MQNSKTATSHQEAQPLVTFIVTFYNFPVQMLCECINSILALSLRPFEREIIIVDDGSETSPMNGLMQYGEEIIYVRQKNGGVSEARNTALRMAKGKYIQIVDGDDYLLQAPYEHCLDLIRYSNNLDVVLFDFTKSPTKGDSVYHDSPIQTGTDFMRQNNIHGAVCCMLFRQVARSKLLFTPGIEYGEDEEFTPQMLLRAETIIETDAKAYFYRSRNSSAIHQQNDERKHKRLDDTMEVILHLNHDVIMDIRKVCFESSKMTEQEKNKVISTIRPKLRTINKQLRQLTLALRYTSFLDVWNELMERAYYMNPATKHDIITRCRRQWWNNAKSVR